jgi:diguanylate cyclase (GGDEF)-like protein
MQLQSKILLLLVPLIVLPILALGWASYSLLMDDARDRTQFQMSTLLKQIESHTESQLRTARANASLFASTDLISRYARTDLSASQKDALEPEILDLLFNYQLAYPEYYEIRIVAPDGTEQLRSALGGIENLTTDESASEYFREVSRHPDVIYTTFFNNPDNSEPALLTSKPLLPLSGKEIKPDSPASHYGYLLLTVDLEFLRDQAKTGRVGESGEVFFTDTAGTILFHRQKERVGEQLDPALFDRLKKAAGSQMTIDGEYFSRAAHFQGMKLHDRIYMFSVYPEDDLLAKSISLGRSVALITLAAILVTTALLFGFFRKVLVKPIRKLSIAAREMGRGQVLVPIDVDARDEIGDLARTFREMGKNLNYYHEQVNFVANHDSLTGLPNRLMFKEYLSLSATQARRNSQGMSILFMDLDNFKRVNDTLGHQIGDKLLEAIADRLSQQLREMDVLSRPVEEDATTMIARLAGDEFIILLPGTAGPEESEKVARRIIDSLVEPFVIYKQEIHISGSIGIALYPTDGTTADELLKNADIAMYHAKNLGRNNFQYYSSELNKALVEKLEIESRLRRAVENNELELHYQPQMDLASGRICGVESLLRWHDPELGQVPPDKFVAVAEEFGLIVQISEWVIYEACRQARQWLDIYPEPVTMSINISAVHFNGYNLESVIAEALQATDLDPKYLELELTETSILEDPRQAISMLNRFKEMGLHVSLDDFGTGYSSLSYLMKLPLDKLKIDQSFIRELGQSASGTSIVSAIIAMAHSLGLSVIAEGVEEESHVELLREMKCDILQGYHIARPMPARKVENMIEYRLKRSA